MNIKNYLQTGQVGIIAVLVGIVIFTLGMSVAARVVTDTRLASRSEEGIRAYAAAEAAMEIAMSRTIQELLTSPSGTWTDGQLVDADYAATALPARIAGEQYEYKLGPMSAGDTRTVWLVNVANDPNLNPFSVDSTPYSQDFQIAWFGPPGTSVEVTVYYNDLSLNEEVSVWRQFVTTQGNSVLIDPSNPDNRPPNYDPTTDRFYLARIKMIEGSAVDGVFVYPDPDTGTFPIQEFSIVANGMTRDDQIRRRTTGKRKVGEIPAFFDYVLANGGGNLVKQ